MGFDKAAGNRQPQSCATVRTAQGIIDLIKLFENELKLILGDANARVCDLECHLIVVGERAESYAALSGEALGIVNQINHDLADACSVNLGFGQVVSDVDD